MSGSAAQLYDEDFVRWTEEQSSALRDAARVDTNLLWTGRIWPRRSRASVDPKDMSCAAGSP